MSTHPFDTLAGFEEAVLRLLERGERALRVFDPDLKLGPLASAAAVDCLERLMHRTPKAELILVLHDTAHLATHCPRLLELRRRRGHQFHVLQTAAEHRQYLQPFLIGDRRDVVTRFHADHLRGKLCLDEPAEAAGFTQRFEALQEKATPASGLDSLCL